MTGSKAERLYKHLRRQGKSKRSAARLAEAETGRALGRVDRARKRRERR